MPAVFPAFAEDVLFYVNQARAEYNLRPVKLDTVLMAAAGVRAEELVTKFSHNRPCGKSWGTVLDEFSVDWFFSGENLAYGYDDAKSAVDGWLNSTTGHRETILNPNYLYLGVGNSGTYWSQLFTG